MLVYCLKYNVFDLWCVSLHYEMWHNVIVRNNLACTMSFHLDASWDEQKCICNWFEFIWMLMTLDMIEIIQTISVLLYPQISAIC